MKLGDFGSGKTGAYNYFFVTDIANVAKDERAKGESKTWNEFTEKRRWIAKRKLKATKTGSVVQRGLQG